jgi:type I restriction enzyme R subunit
LRVCGGLVFVYKTQIFVTGPPLVLLDHTRPGEVNATLRGAFNQIQTYRAQIPDIFTWNQVTVISDGIQARAGSLTARWEHYAPWKTIHGQDLAPPSLPQYEVLVQGMFHRAVLLDLVRNFVAAYGEGAHRRELHRQLPPKRQTEPANRDAEALAL